MSFRSWMLSFAIGIITIALAWFSWVEFSTYQQSHANERNNAAQHQTDATQQGIETCETIMDESGVFGWLTCLAEKVSIDGGIKQSEYDLKAQQDMAAWAFGMLIVTVWLAVITFLGVLFVWRTFLVTRKMAHDTEKFGRSQTRAYVAIRISRVVIEAGKPFSAIVTAHNCGATPAVGVRVLGDIQVSKPIAIKSTAIGMLENEKSEFGSFVEPGGNCHITLETDKNEILSDQDVVDIRNGEMIVRGVIYTPYQDIFENQCWTRKDFEISGDYGVSTGNVMDIATGPNSDCG